MNCEELEELFELYALGALEADETAEIDAHLTRGCAKCSGNLSRATAMNSSFLSLTTEETPPARLKHRVLASIGYERPGWGWAGALAAALMLIVALWLGNQERERANE